MCSYRSLLHQLRVVESTAAEILASYSRTVVAAEMHAFVLPSRHHSTHYAIFNIP